MTLDDEILKTTVAAYLANGHNQRATAKELGVARSTLQERLEKAASRGLVPRREWAPDEQNALPAGFSLKGVSTLVDGQWFKVDRDRENLVEIISVIDDAFLALVGKAPPIPAPSFEVNEDLLTVYVLADHHLGLYSWAQETGENYDTEIASHILTEAMTDLVANTPASAEAVVLNLGDFFHSDSDENRTRKSGNALDVDTRYARVLRTGIDLTIATVQLALQKHMKVEYRALAGNHDPYASLALALAVGKFFEKEKRVTVNIDPGYFWVRQWGSVMLSATHGDMARPEDMPSIVASKWPKVWGETKWRYSYLGHVHSKNKGGGDKHGLVWETFQSLAAKDSWHSQMGYTAGRSMTAITHHKKMGERFRTVRSLDIGE